jgi:hypothetical protein
MIKFKCINVVLLLVALLFVSNYSHAYTPKDQLEITLSKEVLMGMNANTRNNLFYELEKVNNKTSAATVKETVKDFSNMDLAEFRGKLDVVSDMLVTFFEKIGIKANEFIKTDFGFLLILLTAYQIGLFGGLWSIVVGSILIVLSFWFALFVNSKKTVTINTYDRENKIVSKVEKLVPRFNSFEGSGEQ